jgi:gentisate 1,2-dioxygenase
MTRTRATIKAAERVLPAWRYQDPSKVIERALEASRREERRRRMLVLANRRRIRAAMETVRGGRSL